MMVEGEGRGHVGPGRCGREWLFVEGLAYESFQLCPIESDGCYYRYKPWDLVVGSGGLFIY